MVDVINEGINKEVVLLGGGVGVVVWVLVMIVMLYMIVRMIIVEFIVLVDVIDLVKDKNLK